MEYLYVHRSVVLWLAALALYGQTPTGEIRLEVHDPTGAPMQASGKLENAASGVGRTFSTGTQGRFTFENLPIGRYRLEVSRDGFVTQTLTINVPSAAPVTRLVTMALAAAASSVTVIAAAPLPGVELIREEIPTPVQTADQRDLGDSGALDLSDFMNRRLNGVHLNEVQGNPFQADLNYRGYTASPLLGTPQGFSVYMDGVRLNQPFGDVVSWDLIPRLAIAETTLMPGSNPLFGLNTLGGALSIQTKDGHTNPGTVVELSGGSFGRKAAEIEHGGARANGLNWYLAGDLYFEDGWRVHSPSDVRQFFGKLGWQGAKTALGVNLAYANNSLDGNGLQEQGLLARDYTSFYTRPDNTANRSPFVNLTGRHNASSQAAFFGNAYYRYIRTNSLNGDVNTNSLDQSVYQPSAADQAALRAAGYTGFPTSGANATNTPFPFWRCIAQAIQNDEPGEKCDGLLNRSHDVQHNWGLSGQMTFLSRAPAVNHNQLTAGAAYDHSSVSFDQSTQLGYLNPDRTVTGINAFADGKTGGTVDGVPYDLRVDLEGLIHTWSAYATDALSLGAKWHLTWSGRYNRTVIDNRDQLRPGGGAASLNGHDVFGRFNPAAGVTFSPTRAMNAYVSYSEGSRAPASIELGCADPNQPCKLPNAMAGDPPLDQVVTRTIEAGIRGGLEGNLRWSAGWYRAENDNDLLFVASPQTGFGYFKNFGKTRRQGLDAELRGHVRQLNLGGGYTFLDATYQSAETVNGSSNSSNDAGARGFDGDTRILAGDQIPLIPRHQLKAYADFQATRKLSLDAGLLALSSSYARGNENNRHQPDGVYYLGPGKSPGYALLNLGARFQLRRRVQVFVQIANLFDRHYYSAAQLGSSAFTTQGAYIARPFPAMNGNFPIVHSTFYAPGAPRSAVGGVRVQF